MISKFRYFKFATAIIIAVLLVLVIFAFHTARAAALAYESGDTFSSEKAADGVGAQCSAAIAVQNANDSGPGSLRQAITDICPGGTITFAGDYTIYLGSTLYLDNSLTIDGSHHNITVSGDTGHDGTPNVRVFDVGAGSVVTLIHLSVVSGTADSAGGLYNAGGTVRVIDSTFSGNVATLYGCGGIDNLGTLTVTYSTFSGNVATAAGWSSGGGGLCNSVGKPVTAINCTFSGNSAKFGGGLYNAGTLTVTNSTFSGNLSESGGGLYNNGTLTVTNSTFAGNLATSYGGGLYSIRTLTLRNTILANSLSGGDCYGSVATGSGYNLIEATGTDACDLSNGVNGNLIGQDPLLGALQANGGPTWTQALLAGSPAIDAGDNTSCPALDQRGFPRLGRCDIGAYEVFDGLYLYLPLIRR